MTKHTTLAEHSERMKALGDILVKHTFPMASPADEEDVSVLKKREVVVDGYELGVSYSKSDYGDYLIETLQVWSKYSPFVPFCVVCKVARHFLGGDHLSLVEIFRENKKVYIWTVPRNPSGKAVESPCSATEYQPQEFEGFRYRLMNPDTVKFY